MAITGKVSVSQSLCILHMEYHNLYIVENSKYLNGFYLEKTLGEEPNAEGDFPRNIKRDCQELIKSKWILNVYKLVTGLSRL